jgi:hypothetical protein
VAASNEKVTLCHATNSLTNPFVEIEVSVGGLNGHRDGEAFHVNAKTGLQDFLLGDLESCDEVPDNLEVTPLAPGVSGATCEAAGTLTLTEVDGVTYIVEPAYAAGDSGSFTVTATADEGFTTAEGAETEFEVTVAAQLSCVAAVAPSVSAPTCAAPGALTVNAVTGVAYVVNPAYAAGATGSFTVTASATAGFTLTGPSVFAVNVPEKLVCQSGTQGGNPPPPVRTGTLANTAMDIPATELPATLLALLAVASLGYLGHRNVLATRASR